jgi:hypothetical protein
VKKDIRKPVIYACILGFCLGSLLGHAAPRRHIKRVVRHVPPIESSRQISDSAKKLKLEGWDIIVVSRLIYPDGPPHG